MCWVAGRDPIAPEYLMSVIDAHASDNAILTCDSGTAAAWYARDLKLKRGDLWAHSPLKSPRFRDSPPGGRGGCRRCGAVAGGG